MIPHHPLCPRGVTNFRSGVAGFYYLSIFNQKTDVHVQCCCSRVSVISMDCTGSLRCQLSSLDLLLLLLLHFDGQEAIRPVMVIDADSTGTHGRSVFQTLVFIQFKVPPINIPRPGPRYCVHVFLSVQFRLTFSGSTSSFSLARWSLLFSRAGFASCFAAGSLGDWTIPRPDMSSTSAQFRLCTWPPPAGFPAPGRFFFTSIHQCRVYPQRWEPLHSSSFSPAGCVRRARLVVVAVIRNPPA